MSAHKTYRTSWLMVWILVGMMIALLLGSVEARAQTNYCTNTGTQTRAEKGSALTWAELDDWFENVDYVCASNADINLGEGSLEAPNSTTLPGTCIVGQVYFDTDATAGLNWFGCTSTNTWTLLGDGGGGGGGSAIVYDLGDDGIDESVDLAELAVVNDTGSAWSEPTADKALFDGASLLYESELDSEAELEGQIADATNIFTNNDGALSDDDLSDDLITALSGVTTVNDGSYCQGGAGSGMDCDVATIPDGDVAATISRDSEAVAAGDVSGSLGAGYTVNTDAVTTSKLADGADVAAVRDVLHVDPADTSQVIYYAAPSGGTDGCAGAGDKVLFDATTGGWLCGSDSGAAGGDSVQVDGVDTTDVTINSTDTISWTLDTGTSPDTATATVDGVQYGTAFPGTPATGDVFAVTDDSAIGACDSAAGSTTTLCRYNGTSWEALGDGGGAGSDPSAGQYHPDRKPTTGLVTASSDEFDGGFEQTWNCQNMGGGSDTVSMDSALSVWEGNSSVNLRACWLPAPAGDFIFAAKMHPVDIDVNQNSTGICFLFTGTEAAPTDIRELAVFDGSSDGLVFRVWDSYTVAGTAGVDSINLMHWNLGSPVYLMWSYDDTADTLTSYWSGNGLDWSQTNQYTSVTAAVSVGRCGISTSTADDAIGRYIWFRTCDSTSCVDDLEVGE